MIQEVNIHAVELLDVIVMLLGVAIVVIFVLSSGKQSAIRLQAAHRKIEELEQRMEEQEQALSQQQCLYQLDKCFANIRAKYPMPEKNWTNYHQMKQDIDNLLNGWIAAFEDKTQLAEREVLFCTYLLIYSQLTLDEIAQYICYSEKSIRNYKQRIAQKLGVSSADLYNHLQGDIMEYLYKENINPKK